MDDDGDGNADGVDVVMTMMTMLKGGDGDDAEIVLVPCVRRLVGDRCAFVPPSLWGAWSETDAINFPYRASFPWRGRAVRAPGARRPRPCSKSDPMSDRIIKRGNDNNMFCCFE